jgi:hypothetical protein
MILDQRHDTGPAPCTEYCILHARGKDTPTGRTGMYNGISPTFIPELENPTEVPKSTEDLPKSATNRKPTENRLKTNHKRVVNEP